ncbi:alpha/beta fold hydrolase [Dongia deserti]|uniref:alpha/beta fold hydrolase n=1 Tax=Dongia deserti TaxID=2268030 RepID=UPI0013C4BB1B|nr:alpha/beta hydrolase [Dongia deserti]
MAKASRFFPSSQGRIRYDIHGEGAPVVLVHGTPSSSFVWEKVWPRLASRLQVITYDLAGYGASDKYEDQDVRLRAQAHVLAEFVAHLGLARPHLVGHDFGAATVLGAHLVERVGARSLTVIDGVTLNPWGTPYSLLVRANVAVFRALPAYVHEAMLAAHLRSAVSRVLDEAALLALLGPWTGEAGQAAYYRQVAQYDHDFTGLLETLYPSITVPTQILWGAEDRWLAPETAKRLQSLIPDARLSYLPDAGHFAMLDTPNLVAEKIEAFLETI